MVGIRRVVNELCQGYVDLIYISKIRKKRVMRSKVIATKRPNIIFGLFVSQG